MENVCHTLCGLAIARAGGDRLGPLATPVIVVAANLPDLDIVTLLTQGKPGYLCNHRGLTHALLGIFVESLILAGVVHQACEWTERACAPFKRLWSAAALGLLSHVVLDGLNTYGIRPWLPFLERWHYGDIAFILDPWLWLGFGAAACLGAPKKTWATVIPWWCVLGLGALFLCTHPRSNPAIAAAWIAGAALVLSARHLGVGSKRRQGAALAAIGGTLVYLAALGVQGRVADARAREVVEAATGAPVQTSTCQPAPAIPWCFTAVVDSAGALHRVEVNLRTGRSAFVRSLPKNLEHPAVSLDAVRTTPEYRAWRTFARNPFVGEHQGMLVLGDGRYSSRAEDAWCNLVLPLPR